MTGLPSHHTERIHQPPPPAHMPAEGYAKASQVSYAQVTRADGYAQVDGYTDGYAELIM